MKTQRAFRDLAQWSDVVRQVKREIKAHLDQHFPQAMSDPDFGLLVRLEPSDSNIEASTVAILLQTVRAEGARVKALTGQNADVGSLEQQIRSAAGKDSAPILFVGMIGNTPFVQASVIGQLPGDLPPGTTLGPRGNA